MKTLQMLQSLKLNTKLFRRLRNSYRHDMKFDVWGHEFTQLNKKLSNWDKTYAKDNIIKM